ncbi:penicillin-binding protein 2 [Isoptericola variabilis]|uniref:peptidoglycan D,D-transpeptidase FtsI family protein n=1 Tax=Isoptericola variabilis TaxID=139208 RepID=UPI000300BED8|nr:penicillin-binding protein 2 [Isoptericola variabilis]
MTPSRSTPRAGTPRASTPGSTRAATAGSPRTSARRTTTTSRQAAPRAAAPARRTPARRPPAARPPAPAREPGNPERRQRWLIVAAAIVLALFVGRLVQVQVVQGPALAAAAQADRLTTSVTLAHRGDIVDANGTVLATSVDRYTVVADQVAIQGFRGNGRVDTEGEPVEDGALGIAQLLGPVLGKSKAELGAQLNGDRRYVVLAKDVVPEVQRAIADLRLQAYVRTDLTSRRTYPAGTVAGTLVGFVNDEQKGAGGIEAAYDDALAGTDGKLVFERGRDGVMIPTAASEAVEAVPGDDVVLTIDADVQWKAEDLLDQAVRDTGAQYGMAIVSDVRTGELLALADSGDVDPNDRSTAKVAEGSRAVKDVFEPGSTGKVVSVAAALEEGYWKPTDRFEVPYRFTTPNGQTFKDSHEHPVQRLTLAGVLAHSSNTGTVQMGEKIPVQVRYDYLRKFGFGERTGLGLPGESAGLLPSEDTLRHDARTPYTILFGQGLAVSALQATQVFSTVANGGVRLTPTLFAGTRSADGAFTPAPREDGVRVVSQETADTLLRMLEAVTGEEGTGTTAQVPGYRVAGKTGTAQLFESGGTRYMASFIGVAPADDPRFTVAVFLKDPKSSIYGGVVAGPVFSDLMAYALQKAGVPPSEPAAEDEQIPLEW